MFWNINLNPFLHRTSNIHVHCTYMFILRRWKSKRTGSTAAKSRILSKWNTFYSFSPVMFWLVRFFPPLFHLDKWIWNGEQMKIKPKEQYQLSCLLLFFSFFSLYFICAPFLRQPMYFLFLENTENTSGISQNSYCCTSPYISYVIIIVVVAVWICCRYTQVVDAVCFRSFDYVKLVECSGVKNNGVAYSSRKFRIPYSMPIAILFITEAKLWICNCSHWHRASDDITFEPYFGIWIFPWVESSEKWKQRIQHSLV